MNETACRRVVAARAGLGDPAMARCERCGAAPPLTAHHRVKAGQGGGWTPSNIVAVCGHGTAGCHGWIEANPADARAQGWALTRGQDPAGVPVVLVSLGVRALLDDDGTIVPVEWADRAA